MRKVLLIFFLAFFAILFFYFTKNIRKPKEQSLKKINKNVPTIDEQTNSASIKSKSIFVPYWNLSLDTRRVSEYDRFIYFGVTPTRIGIDKQEQGYKGIEKFIEFVPSDKKKYLTVRMIEDDINNFILENEEIQQKIISETMEIVEKYGFNGVVLDLEIFNIFNEDITKQMNNFVQSFYTEVNKDYRQFSVILYGDVFSKHRPFDVAFLEKNTDEIMIMAYDFHKSRGEPGPNFPYDLGLKYSYSFKNMLQDYLKVVPKEKLTVIFGMFGYDWLVDEKKRPIRQAKALSLNEIKKTFLDICEFQNCIVKRDELSKETEINYIISSEAPDEEGIFRIDYHIVWFEDQESVKIKIEYLQKKGIENITYWVYGYF